MNRRQTSNTGVHNITQSQEVILYALKGGVPVNGHQSWRKLFESIGEAFSCSKEIIMVMT